MRTPPEPEHNYQYAGTDGGPMTTQVELAARAARRTGNPQMVHAHVHGADCNLSCRGVLAPPGSPR